MTAPRCQCGAQAAHHLRNGAPLCCFCNAGIEAHGDAYEEYRLLNLCRIAHPHAAASAEAHREN